MCLQNTCNKSKKGSYIYGKSQSVRRNKQKTSRKDMANAVEQININLGGNYIIKAYLQNVPNQEKPIIFWCQWLSVEWNPSKQLVWTSEESCLISPSRLFLVSKPFSLSCAAVPTNIASSRIKKVILKHKFICTLIDLVWFQTIAIPTPIEVY